ncbi:NAD(+) diphosphatase [Sphaerisporangium sp. TRM90804]|uniref:NAD(+) diphosphatase n=1 Tax=Sphaerisporangium sp. TRM90804 TaxID=3031113 RepID=UPI0024474DE7|nr:NAD(+) diphosphatase [Sphaerisporangium sp. TRM90804]MDH2429811.1 NAD(+) diphosphatase [Sphaerisporangium sp. TRM90804]
MAESRRGEGLLGPLLLARGGVDRSAVHRTDEAWLKTAWADPATRVLLVGDGHTLVRRHDDTAELVFLAPHQTPPGERYLLGVDPEGVAYFAVAVDGPLNPTAPGTEVAEAAPGARDGRAASPDARVAAAVAGAGVVPPQGETEVAEAVQDVPDWADIAAEGLRRAGAALGDRDAGLLVNAVALEAWHTTHEHCPRCGARTTVVAGGHMRVCPDDGSQHFPRVDPAVIMLVRDADDRCLLARGPQWPEGRFSVLAGFVESGESLEQAVAREVLEEVGVTVAATRYLGSQPWPFPRSLMLGFFAEATSTRITLDGDEIAEAMWVTREELRAAVESGEIRLPPGVSIARRLIETWYGSPLTGDW